MTKTDRHAERCWIEQMSERNVRAANIRRIRRKPIWKKDAFWFVLLPTAFALALIGLAFMVRGMG